MERLTPLQPPPHASSQAGEDSALPQAGATPPGEDASLSQANTSHPTPLPSLPTSLGEDASLSQASTPLPSQPTPPGEDASLPQASTPPTPLPSQPTALLPSPEDRGAPNLPNTQAGQSNNPINYPRQGNRHPPRQSPPRPPRRFILPPGKAITPPPPTRHPQGSSKEEPNPKWVINLSNKPLTPAQRSVLAKGPNFVVYPQATSQLRVHNCHRSSLY